MWSKTSKGFIGSDIEVEELINVGCEMVFGDTVEGCTVLYEGTLEILVTEVVDVL